MRMVATQGVQPFQPTGHQQHLGAGCGQHQRQSATNATGGACHHGTTAAEIEQLRRRAQGL
jgi:hypothetical protein